MLTRRLFVDSVGDEVALAQRAKAELRNLGDGLPDARQFAEYARDDANLASAMLYEALLRDPHHGSFIDKINGLPTSEYGLSSMPLLVIVPGMFFREYPEIGADGGLMVQVAQRLGIETCIAPTLSLGGVSENLEILNEYLSGLGGRPFWLVSMSRGSAEIKWLLSSYPDAAYLPSLQCWISICGIVLGSPLHERIYANRVLGSLHRGFARINGINPELGEELLCSNSKWRSTPYPHHLRIINVIAVPLSWHITNSAIRRYHRIRHLGPTDGVVLLADYLNEPGLIYPIWGVDHFMRTTGIAALFYRLLYFLSEVKGESDE